MVDANEIGEWRTTRELGRGFNVLLADGRWALLLEAPGPSLLDRRKVTARVSVNYVGEEYVSWVPGEKVFSRDPGQQVMAVEAVIASLKPSGGAP